VKFDIEALKQIPIEDVLELLGARKSNSFSHSKTIPMHCFCGFHKHGDKHPSLIVWKNKNICKCMVNPDIRGDSINIVEKILFGGDFKQACVWLHENFGIPYLEEDDEYSYDKENIKNKHSYIAYKKPKKIPQQKKIECLKIKDFTKVDIEKFLPKYNSLKPHQKLKLLYSYIYNHSLKTDQTIKINYYKSRGIENCSFINQIGSLNKEDIGVLTEKLLKTFPKEDLIEFKIINPSDHHKRPLEFKYITKETFCVIPSFELNNNLLNGLILRSTKTYEWQKAKEFQITNPSTLIPVPFPFNRALLNKNKIIITEGHIDTLSIAQFLSKEYAYLAVPGIYNAAEEYLCLLKDKEIYIAFDQDEAGILGAKKLIEKLDKYTKDITILQWQEDFGKDLNELLKNGYMGYLIEKFDLLPKQP